MTMTIPGDFAEEMVQAGVKAAMKNADAKSGDLWFAPLDKLVIRPGFNLRITGTKAYDEGIATLAGMIAENGFSRNDPLKVLVLKTEAGTELLVVDGHRRKEATLFANANLGTEVTELPFTTLPPGTTLEDAQAMMITSATAEALTPLELAIGCKRLQAQGLDDEKIAKRIGKSPKYVGDLIFLAGAPVSITKMVAENKVAAHVAVTELRAHGKEAVSRLKAGLKVANDAGQTKVSKKHLDPKPKGERKPRTPKAPAVATPPAADIPTEAYFLRKAIVFALDDDDNGFDWLEKFASDDALAVAQLEDFIGQPHGSFFDASLRVSLTPAAAAATTDDDEL